MDWLYRTNFDQLTIIAIWSIIGVLVTTVVLFVYTIGLRVATLVGDKRRAEFVGRWRSVFATAMLSEDDAHNCAVPKIGRNDNADLLEEWNRTRSIVDGTAVDNLIILARRVAIPATAVKLLHKHRVRAQILATQTIGHLRDQEQRDEIRSLVDHENTALSITAVVALVEIDPDFAVSIVVPMIEKRRDWPKNRVSIMLRMAGSERISEPMYRAIRSADDVNKTYLMQFARLMDAEVLDALVEDLIRTSENPGVLNAALKLVSGYGGVPRIAALTQHAAWFVRMQSAKVLGRIGQEEHLSLLESLLDDVEWWVRYRAAQAITSLPFLGPNQLRQIRDRQTDRFASDILEQSFAEVGIA